ncbi:MAG: TetR/AcrR family transcriptional regulator [Candidatus Sericytochromatia bacterium]
MPRGRARNDEDKLERRLAILAVAKEALASTPFQAIAMAQVAERVGLAKGTLYLYFATKEELFLALLEEELLDWFDGFGRMLRELRVGAGPRVLAEAIRKSLESHPLLPRLLGILHAVLEQNVAPERVVAFKRLLAEETERAGAALERCAPYLGPGQGARLILRANALVIGLQQVASASPAVAEAIGRTPELALFEVNFAQELEETLAALLMGMEREGETRVQPRTERKNRPGDGRFERPWG